MNTAQRKVLIAAAVLLLISIVFVPYMARVDTNEVIREHFFGYHLVVSPPTLTQDKYSVWYVSIDYRRLGLEVVAIIMLSALAVYLLKDYKGSSTSRKTPL